MLALDQSTHTLYVATERDAAVSVIDASGCSALELTLRVETPGSNGPAGGHVESVGTCIDVLRLSGNALWCRPDASTRALLAALMPAD